MDFAPKMNEKIEIYFSFLSTSNAKDNRDGQTQPIMNNFTI